jgi:hypothetical protein
LEKFNAVNIDEADQNIIYIQEGYWNKVCGDNISMKKIQLVRFAKFCDIVRKVKGDKMRGCEHVTLYEMNSGKKLGVYDQLQGFDFCMSQEDVNKYIDKILAQ